MKIAITGATGYIGRQLLLFARQHGHQVLAMSRKPSPDTEWIAFDLLDGNEPNLPKDVDAVVHLAATTGATDTIRGYEERAAAGRLIDACEKIGAYFVFVSSQTATANAQTAYGQLKWEIERLTLERGGSVVRPGLVYGGPEKALFGRMVSLVKRLPVLPEFFPALYVQPVHVDDLAKALVVVCCVCSRSDIYLVGDANPVKFSRFLKVIASERQNRCAFFVPVPMLILKLAASVLGSSKAMQVGLDRLVSLSTLPQMKTGEDLARLSIQLRPLEEGMRRAGTADTRGLIKEGNCLLHYVLREAPVNSLIRRYVRFVKQSGETRGPLKLPRVCLRFPGTVAFLEESPLLGRVSQTQFGSRLAAAISLADANPQGARRFMLLGRNVGLFKRMLILANAIVGELSVRCVRLVSKPLFMVCNFLRNVRV